MCLNKASKSSWFLLSLQGLTVHLRILGPIRNVNLNLFSAYSQLLNCHENCISQCIWNKFEIFQVQVISNSFPSHQKYFDLN